MSLPSTAVNPYDEIPFPSQPVAQTDPSRLAAMGLLFGMSPRAADGCRLLELGAATGGNIIPMAERYPGSTFVGVDNSPGQIEQATQIVAAVGLKNIELRCQDIGTIGDELDLFDYIVCHGVFSWVSPSVQEQILAVCRQRLQPQGIAIVSYNVFPGWHVRKLVRDLLCGFTPATERPRVRAAQGRKLLEFFSVALAEAPTHANQLLKGEIDEALGQADDYLLHEYFEPENAPLYFHEFVGRAAQHGLQYLADADLATISLDSFSPAVAQALTPLATDATAIEQHLDLLKNRAFRQSLVCRDDVPLVRELTSQTISRLRFAGSMRPEGPAADIQSSALVKFVTQSGTMFWSPTPMIKAVLGQLGESWPRAVSFDDLLAGAAARLGSEERTAEISIADREIVARDLAHCTVRGLLEIRSAADRFVTIAGSHPRASPLVRLQAVSGTILTNQRHQWVNLDEFGRHLLGLLDGQRDRAALLAALVAASKRGTLTLPAGALQPGQTPPTVLEKLLEQYLTNFATFALLSG